jgi:hypothetical protein
MSRNRPLTFQDENEAPQEDTDGNAFTELMAPKVRIGTKNPFILQVRFLAF